MAWELGVSMRSFMVLLMDFKGFLVTDLICVILGFKFKAPFWELWLFCLWAS